ncbi:MAG: 3-deoxy-manno-octulosonate-8-phosphatase KdsC [Proteobacteria bacterium]|nr:3-deoxy-manno-octulosonate-8-phosphatase KdsC [Pseudomonadota bacterium]
MSSLLVNKAEKIKLVIFDVDGTLTDGYLHYLSDGTEGKSFHVRDGLGLVLLMKAGIEVATITASKTPIITQRMEALKVKHVYQGQFSKLAAYEDLLSKLNLAEEQIAYIGDDLPDLMIMRRVGLSVAVNDAHDLVRECAHWVTSKNGGHGAVRELCDLILNAQNKLDFALQKFLET